MIDGIREKIFKENTYSALKHYEQAFFAKTELINNLIDSIQQLRKKNTSESLDLLYNQIKKKQEEVGIYREELSQIRNKYHFFNIETEIEILSINLAGAKSSHITEKGKYEIYKESLNQNDTLLLNTQARMEGARQIILQFEKQLNSLNEIKKKYVETQDKLKAGIHLLNQLNQQYENTVNAFEPFTNSILLERLINDYTHQQILLNELRYKYENALSNYQNPIPSVYVISQAEPVYHKVGPSLKMNAIIIIGCSLVFAIGFLLLFDKYRMIKNRITEKT
jgi:hypothetical protein